MRTVAFVLVGLGALLTFLDWWCWFESWRRKRHVSPAFPLPGALTASGLALLAETRPWWWLGLAADPTFYALVLATPRLAAEAWRTSSYTRLATLVADTPPRHVTLSLHRRGHFHLRVTFDPPQPCNAYGALINSFGLVGRWEKTPDRRLRLFAYRDDRVLVLDPDGAGYVTREEGYPEGVELPYDALDGLRFVQLTDDRSRRRGMVRQGGAINRIFLLFLLPISIRESDAPVRLGKDVPR